MLSKCAIRLLGCLIPSIARAFCTFKQTQINAFSCNRNVSLPFFSSRMPRYSCIARFIVVCLGTIQAILLVGHFPKIAKSVVRTIPINMVNFAKRPRAICHSQGNPVCWHNYAIDANFNVAIAICACLMPSFCPQGIVFPNQISRVWVVRQFLVQDVDRNFSHAPDISSILNGSQV